MNKFEVIDLWKKGLSIDSISEQYKQEEKLHGIKISKREAQCRVEPIIFEYQTGKRGVSIW